MYFVNSTAKALFAEGSSLPNSTSENPQQDGRPLISISHCPGAYLFAAISTDTIYLWSARPITLLSSISRSNSTIFEDGENKQIIWHPNGEHLVVVTTKGMVHFYEIITTSRNPHELQFKIHHHFSLCAGEYTGDMSKAIRFTMALDIDTEVECGVGLANEILLATRKSPAILSLSWTGEVSIPGTVSLQTLAFYLCGNQGVTSMTYCPAGDLFLWITAKGAVYVTRRVVDRSSLETTWSGVLIYAPKDNASLAASVSINSSFALLGVGTQSGHVIIFTVSEEFSGLKFSHECAAQKVAGSANRAVTAMEWTSDGQALAVFFNSGRFCLWSTYGLLIFSTTFQELCSTGETPIEDLPSNEPFSSFGLFWGLQDFELYLYSAREGSNDICVLNFGKALVSRTSGEGVAGHVLLLCDDRLLFFEAQNWDLDSTKSAASQWMEIAIPMIYLARNWPIKYAAVSANGRYIAIAGARGLIHYNTILNRWKLFGNEQEEDSFCVTGGVAWLDNLIIFGCQTLVTRENQIRIIARDANLSLSNLLSIERVPSPVAFLTLSGARIATYSMDNLVRIYTVYRDGEKNWLSLDAEVSMQRFSVNTTTIQSLTICPDDDVSRLSNILLLNRGELSLMRESEGSKWEMLNISDKVENFWVSRDPFQPKHQTSKLSLWIKHPTGLKVRLNFDSANSDGFEPDLSIHVDFYPLTIWVERGMTVGVEQSSFSSKALNTIILRPQIRTQLFLPSILGYLLRHGRNGDATSMANNFRKYPYFNHAMELLVYNTLEEDAEAKISHASSLLPAVIDLLAKFINKLDIIIQCARKCDMSLWPYFFSIVGDPQVLFQAALDQNLLLTATSYLVAIQALHSPSRSLELAVDLLQKAQASNESEVAEELSRYINFLQDAK